MPLYTYEHPETQETVDIIQGMNDEHSYVDNNGVKWRRVFFSPQASMDSNIDPFDNQSFKDKTGKSKGTMGDIIDRSKEMSQRRTDKLGFDPVKQKYFKEYRDNRRGVRHPLDNT